MKKLSKRTITLIAALVLAVSMFTSVASAREMRSSSAHVSSTGATSVKGDERELSTYEVYGEVGSSTASSSSYVIGRLWTKGLFFSLCRDEKTASNNQVVSVSWYNGKYETGTFWAECERVGSHSGYCSVYQLV